MSEARSLLREGDCVVCLGDSLTADPEGYVTLAREVLRRRLPPVSVGLVNAGVCGDTARGMLFRFDRDVLRHRPTWVTISAGLNDAAQGASPADFVESVSCLIAAAREADVRVGLCTATTLEGPEWAAAVCLLWQYNQWLRETADREGHLLIPMDEVCRLAAAGTAEEPLRLTYDGVHMGPMGRYLMALSLLAAFGVSLPIVGGEVAAAP